MPLVSFNLKLMAKHSIFLEKTFAGTDTLYRATCTCGWNTLEWHTHGEAVQRGERHMDRADHNSTDDLIRDLQVLDELMDEVVPHPSQMDILFLMKPDTWRSADGIVWSINGDDDDGKTITPIMTPTHAQKCIDHLRRRQIYGPFTKEQDRRFEMAPIIRAFRRRIEEADSVEWRDAKWHDWMYEKRHGTRPG